MRCDIENLVMATVFCAALLVMGCTDGSEATPVGLDPGAVHPGFPIDGGDGADTGQDPSERKRKPDKDENGKSL